MLVYNRKGRIKDSARQH